MQLSLHFHNQFRLSQAFLSHQVRIPFISKQLNVDIGEVEQLLVSCIHDGLISGSIDQIQQNLWVGHGPERTRYSAISKWSDQLSSLCNTIQAKIN